MAGGTGSVVTQKQRRSNRLNLGLNGRDAQLNRLGEQLAAPTRQRKRLFAPEDGLMLENNALAPAPKKKRRSKASRVTQPRLPATQLPLQPHQPAPNDGRYGFCPPPPTHQVRSPSTLTQQAIRPPTPTRQVIPSTPTQQVTSLSTSTHPGHPALQPPPLRSQTPLQLVLQDIPELGDSDDEEDEEPDIDEHSDDEDDRRAHAFLRASPNQDTAATHFQPPPPIVQGVAAVAPPQTSSPAGQDYLGFADLGTEQSVLQNHYDRNRLPRAPVFRTVRTAPHPHQPLPPVDPSTDARTLESYPPQWQEVIGLAKRSFRAYIAGHCGFPEGVEGIEEAKECLEDAVEVHREGGGTLEPGHVINRNMCMIVFSESWQLRSQLKADIRVQVRNLKSLFPGDRTHLPRPPHEAQASIREQVSSWVSDGSYLHDTAPDSDEQTHFGHPIIASTCKSFYFDRWLDISTSDRDTFQGSVPKSLVALVGAVYRNALDEWSTGIRSTVKLESKHYGKVYKAILDSMEIVNQDTNHGPLLRQRLSAWAGFGESISSSLASSTNIPVTIRLNLSPPTG